MIRWGLMFDASTRHYVLTEYWNRAGRWAVWSRSSWRTMDEALNHIKARND